MRARPFAKKPPKKIKKLKSCISVTSKTIKSQKSLIAKKANKKNNLIFVATIINAMPGILPLQYFNRAASCFCPNVSYNDQV